jgi:3'(2'), 5'-bisphosphate nucleotidase
MVDINNIYSIIYNFNEEKGALMLKTELSLGEKAVIEAMRMCKTIQKELTSADSITKSDKSPVTIADFTSQAIICRLLKNNFPDIPIVAEESSEVLKRSDNQDILEKIVNYINQDAGIKRIINRENLFDSIDLGRGNTSDGIFWTLDPIDGTKGFLRSEQFAIALALIVEGKVKLGILGCPNMELEGECSTNGYLIYALEGQGAYILNVQSGTRQEAVISDITDPEKTRFVESYVSSHSNMEKQLKIARLLKISKDPVQMDSQVKYGVVATGSAEIYLRIPHPQTPDYREKIWDHAAGSIIVEEAGGIVSDVLGNKLDFNVGKTLKNNRGILASTPAIYPKVLEIIKSLD